MTRLLYALKVGVEAFNMVYKGWCVEEYKKYDKDNCYIEASIWYDNGNFNKRMYNEKNFGWNVSRKGRTYTKLYKNPYEAVVFTECLVKNNLNE